MPSDIVAIDFGTSNSAAAVLGPEGVRLLPVEADAQTVPTAVFFPHGGAAMKIGAAATRAMIEGEDGRYMRSLKSVLGTDLLHEERIVAGRRRTLARVITEFLIALREQAEAASGQRFTKALSGRPVRFHSDNDRPDNDRRNAQAAKDLEACYLDAGFDQVSFMPEPEAAALSTLSLGIRGEIGLIVDIGGGTSDFSVFRKRNSAEPAGDLEILASYGIRLGGTDFDQAVSLAHVMPKLGLGGQLRTVFGSELLPVPVNPFVELATWFKIPFLYSAGTKQMLRDLIKQAVEPKRLERFYTVIDLQLGHELAFAVEDAKIEVNTTRTEVAIALDFIERALSVTMGQDGLANALSKHRKALREAMVMCLDMAGIAAADVDHVILVGGSSLMEFVSDEAKSVCPQAETVRSNAFTAVVDGLALATGQTNNSRKNAASIGASGPVREHDMAAFGGLQQIP
ncbi:MAG: Hsp70 family protein [Pseudomonadota bacterium]